MKLSFPRSNRVQRLRRPLLGACLLLVAGFAPTLMSGCSGGASSKNGFLNQNTGLYTSADQPVGNGVAHTFVDLKNGLPLRQGMEFTTAALDGFSTNTPSLAYIGPMPTVTNGSQFTNVVLTHLPAAIAGTEQFQLSILVRAATVTGEPFSLERASVASSEIPAGFTRSTSAQQPTGVVIPGGGVIYSAGQNQSQSNLYYASHLNGILLGPTLDQLRSKQTLIQSIPQPAIYPRDGYFPTKWEITYDTTRLVHVLEFTDFIRAPKFVPPGS
ncbi:hypothetical protein IAD21_06130 [Abditibacteriota bacterium]|nr:hypothetical protein IAD21_06130 [Abditibacteriota bacterium]